MFKLLKFNFVKYSCCFNDINIFFTFADPLKSRSPNWDLVKHPQIFVHFDYPNQQSNLPTFAIKAVIYFNVHLDFTVLELSDPSKLPPSLKLYRFPISFMEVPSVDIIGYGHPDVQRKFLDSACKIVLPGDPSLQAAQAWLQQNKGRLEQAGLKRDLDHTIEWSYRDYDREDKILFSCYLEHGSSGAPILTTRCPPEPLVVGIVTNGLPHCFWDLSSTAQAIFPPQYRMEMGTRMSSIYQDLFNSDVYRSLANELF